MTKVLNQCNVWTMCLRLRSCSVIAEKRPTSWTLNLTQDSNHAFKSLLAGVIEIRDKGCKSLIGQNGSAAAADTCFASCW